MKTNTWCVYRIISEIDGKMYIGSSKQLESRWRRHRVDLKSGIHHARILQADFHQYGMKAFKFEKLEEFQTEVEAKNRETELIKEFGIYGYNLAPSSEQYLATRTPEEIAKHNVYIKELFNTPYWKKRHSERAKKYLADPKVREEISKRQKSWIENNKEQALLNAKKGGLIGGQKSREKLSKKVIRDDGKIFDAINDAARFHNPEDPERARSCLKQALKRGNRTLGYGWRYYE